MTDRRRTKGAVTTLEIFSRCRWTLIKRLSALAIGALDKAIMTSVNSQSRAVGSTNSIQTDFLGARTLAGGAFEWRQGTAAVCTAELHSTACSNRIADRQIGSAFSRGTDHLSRAIVLADRGHVATARTLASDRTRCLNASLNERFAWSDAAARVTTVGSTVRAGLFGRGGQACFNAGRLLGP